MSIGLIVMRTGGAAISMAEWADAVALDPDLRMRTVPYETTNPRTGEVIRMAAGEADAELREGERWVPFLRFGRGKLKGEFIEAYSNARDPGRLKIAAIAGRLNAVIATDADDEFLNW